LINIISFDTKRLVLFFYIHALKIITIHHCNFIFDNYNFFNYNYLCKIEGD